MQQQSLMDQLYDIYGIVHVPFWQKLSFIIPVSTILFLMIVVPIVWIMVKRRKKVTPWNRALNAVAHSYPQHMSNDEIQKSYFELIKIIKQYLFERYDLNLFGKTDQEVLGYLKSLPIYSSLVAVLEQLLSGSVFVRYAKESAAQERIQSDWLSARQLILQTIPTKKK